MSGSEGTGTANIRVHGTRWAKGAAVLGAAAVISKLLGTLQKIPLQNVGGDSAYGIYSIVYPFYTLILFLATAGFPVAVSALVSERISSGDRIGAVRVLKTSTAMLALTGLAGFLLLFFGAEMIAGWIGSGETALALRSVSFALLFVPVMSALRGFFQGCGDMLPTAVSQVAEQFVRVATMIALLIVLTMQQMDDGTVAAGATFGAVTGACAGMAVMLLYWRHSKRTSLSEHRNVRDFRRESYAALAARLLRYALPVSLGAIAIPVMGIVDTFTLPRLILQSGMTDIETAQAIGVYHRGMPLVQMTGLLVTSIAAALVPAMAEARTQGRMDVMRGRAELALRLTWLIGIAASVGLALLALPINVMLFEDGQGTAAMRILAFSAVFSMLNITTASVLQGAGRPGLPAVHLLIAAAVKVGLNYALVPVMDIRGAALAAVIAYGLASLLNVAALARELRLPWSRSVLLYRPVASLVAMAVVIGLWQIGLKAVLPDDWTTGRLGACLAALPAIAAGALVYVAALLRLKAIDPQTLRSLPGAESRLLPLLAKLRLIPR